MKRVLIGFPSYDGRALNTQKYTMIRASRSEKVEVSYIDAECSSLTRVFNTIWAEALNRKMAGVCTHFVMVHDDIMVGDWWLDKMLEIMEKRGADVLSAIVPIKTPEGFTSTGFDEPKGDGTPHDHFRIRRLTMREAFRDYEPTFTAPNILLNTGLMLIDMQKPWVTPAMVFRFENQILPMPDGKLRPFEVSEDWYFSREARKRGATLWATREIDVRHVGRFAYPNTSAWGSAETDKRD